MSHSKKFKVGSPVKIVGTAHNGVQGKIIRVLPVGSKSYVVASAKDGSTAMQYVGTFNKSNLEHNPLPCNGVKQSPSSTQYEVDDAVRFIAPKTDAVKFCGTHNVPIKDAGLQTHIEARFDCLDPSVMKLLAECRGFGVSKYGVDSHKNIPVADHLNHAINHINEHRRGDVSEMHLVNAMCRLLFAISGVFKLGYYEDTYWHPDMGPKHSDKLSNPVSGEKKNES